MGRVPTINWWNVFGHRKGNRSASGVYSFIQSLNNGKYDKSGENIVDAGNEYNLLEYLKKHNRCPEYYQSN